MGERRLARKIVVFLIILMSFLLQCTFFKWLALGGISPNLLLVVTSSFGFMRGRKEGLIVGFLCGLFIDIFYSDLLCFYAFLYMYIGYANGFFHKIFYREDIKLPMVWITVSDFLFSFVSYIFLFLLRRRLDFPYYFMHIMLPEVIYTVFVTLIFYRFILWINGRLEQREKRRESKFV